jgi:hypothetical protein
MSPKTELKHFILRALNRTEGLPLRDQALIESAHGAVTPSPTVGDINQAKRELELDGFIRGHTDDFDKSVSWTLTPKGQHKANQLG